MVVRNTKNFISFNEFEKIGGAEAGKLDLVHDDINVIIDYAIKKCKEFGRDIFEEVPNFKKNLLIAKSKFKTGKTKRYDMPVIPTSFVKEFQWRISQGHIDLNEPFHKHTDPNNPFPQGLSGQEAKEFLKRGLLDGDKDDDKLNVRAFKTQAINLNPIQKQVYVDKSIDKIARDGAQGCRRFLVQRQLITSSDGYIIDGHHRLLTSLIIEPTIKLQGIEIDLDIEVLKKLALAYGDALGNKRNLVNEIIDKLKKPIEDLLIEIEDFYLQNGMSLAFNKEMERLTLIYDFVKSVEKYTKPDDILVDLNYHVSIKNNLTIDITIERSGKKYTLSTDAIYAGGHNIQRLHYRYITKTNLPNTHNKKITDEYKAKIQKMTKIEKINSEINRYEKMISETESKIRELRKKTDEEILDDNSTWNLFAGLTWDDIIKRGAAKNYNYEPKEFYKSKDETRQHAIDSFYRQVSSKERDIILWEKEKRRLLVKLDNEINKI